MKISKETIMREAVALALISLATAASATDPIIFDPCGKGGVKSNGGCPVAVASFDWLPNSALAVKGNPAGGLTTGAAVDLLSQAKLGVMILEDGTFKGPPAGVEFTFVAGFNETATVNPQGVAFVLTPGSSSFFEMWTSTSNSNPLNGTGYNDTKRILTATVVDASGNFNAGSDPNQQIQQYDQFINNDYPGIETITGSGSTQISGAILSADPNYFPNLTQEQIDNLKVFFNTSTVTPFKQTNPSKKFVAAASPTDVGPNGATYAFPNIGNPNGALQFGSDLDFELQSDANQSFVVAAEVEGSCRVTFGGNDANGNVNPAKFSNECSPDQDGAIECYTFGGHAESGKPGNNDGATGRLTHHNKSGPFGDFEFKAGDSAPKGADITDVVCKDPGSCSQASANAQFKQIDFEGLGAFNFPKNTQGDKAQAALIAKGATGDLTKDFYYFRVDMVDSGEPGNKALTDDTSKAQCAAFLGLDVNNPLSTPDPALLIDQGGVVAACNVCADVYQLRIYNGHDDTGALLYEIRGFLTGGNIQLHKGFK
jgi:hypothetical protein